MFEPPNSELPKFLIGPEELPRWVPGQTLLTSDGPGWRGVTMRSYRYTGLDVHVPAMRDYMIVAYRHGLTPMARQFDGHWTHERCVPGDVSLLTRSEESHWHWTGDIDVVHVYLSPQMLAKVSSEAMDRDVVDVRLRDVLKAQDPVIASAVNAIAEECDRRRMRAAGHGRTDLRRASGDADVSTPAAEIFFGVEPTSRNWIQG